MATGTTSAPAQEADGTERKEAGIDSEAICGIAGNPPTEVQSLYQNFNSFVNTGSGTNIETKKKNRHTNLGGPGAGLPQNTSLRWFEWRAQIEAGAANPQLLQNAKMWTQMEQLREWGYIEATFAKTPLLLVPMRDLVSFVDSRIVTVNIPGAVTNSPQVADRGGRSIALSGPDGKPRPYVLTAKDWIEMRFAFPGSDFSGPQNGSIRFAACTGYYLKSELDGIGRRSGV